VNNETVLNATVKSPQLVFVLTRNFPERLAQLILRDGRNKQAIARAAGVHPSALSRWLAGSTPDYDNLERLAGALNVSVNFLLFGDDAGTPAPHGGERLREAPASYHVRAPHEPRPQLTVDDVLSLIEPQLHTLRSGPAPQQRRAYLALRDLHLPALARALNLEG